MKRKRPEENSDENKELMQKALTILEKRQKKGDSEDQFDNYGKYIACQLRQMPERAREYAEFKIQEVIFYAKSYMNNGQQPFQPIPGNSQAPVTPPLIFSTPNTHMQRPLQPQYNAHRTYTETLNNNDL